MKRYYLVGLLIVLALSLGAILYGAWLNERGEVQIMRRMEERQLTLHGAKASVRELRPRVEVSAVKLYSPDMADAVALIDGRITSVLAPKGRFVHKGETIFVIENEDIPIQIKEAESNILSARASLRRAENQYKRFLVLKKHDAVSAQQFDDAEEAYYAAQSNLEVMEARFSQIRVRESRQNVIAPLDGKVLVLYRQPGAYVQGGTSLALVGDFSSLYFSTPIDDKDARHLEAGQEAELVFAGSDFPKVYSTDYAAGNLGSRQKFFAVLAEVNPPLSEKAAIRNVLWKIDNRAGLLEPQTYGNVSFQSLRGHSALAVPISSMADRANTSVFVVNGGVIERRSVKTGTNDGTYIEIVAGLKEGEVVVTSGMEGLAAGMQANVKLDGAEGGGNQ